MKVKDRPRTRHWIGRCMEGSGGRIALLCALSVLSGGGTVALALAVRQVVNAGLAGGAVIPWAALLLALCAGIAALRLWSRWYGGRTRDLLTRRLRRRLLETLLSRRYDALASYHTGDLVSRLGEDAAVLCGETAALPPALAGSAVRLAGALAALAWLNGALAGVLVGAALVLGLAAAALRRPLRQRSRRVREAESAVRTGMQECMDNRETVKGLELERALLDREEDLLAGALKARNRQRNLSAAASGGLEILSQLGYCLVMIWGVAAVAGGAMSFGTLTAMLQLLLQLRGPVTTLSGVLPRLSAAAACAQRLSELAELPEEEAVGGGPAELPEPAALVFSHVDFHYPDDERPVLRDFCLRVEAGEWACLAGPSGRGKSTALRLALGFYRPERGEVYLETGRGPLPCGRAARRLLGYVPQSHALFSGTIRDNLLLADPDADEAKLWAALETACAEFVRSLPRGLDTPLREHGGGLSEGQCQRIALARALLPDTPFLLLDECTSALDRATEREVLRRLRLRGRGALLVSHRADTLPEGVRVIPMEEEP